MYRLPLALLIASASCSLVVEPERLETCDESAAPRCEKTTLVSCRDGVSHRVDCGAEGCTAGRCRHCAGERHLLHVDGHCFFIGGGGETFEWTAAKRACETEGAHLATLTDAATSSAVRSFFCDASGCTPELWIGLHDRDEEGEYAWITGEPVDLLDWGPDSPNNRDEILPEGQDCIRLESNGGKWNDYECNAKKRGLCERDAP